MSRPVTPPGITGPRYRGAQIRTGDLSDPNGARYQAAPHPESSQISSDAAGILSAMADRLRIACVQLTTGRDKAVNLEKTEKLVARAASTGADVVALLRSGT